MNRQKAISIGISAALGIALVVLVVFASGLYGSLAKSYSAGASSAPSGSAGSAVSAGSQSAASAAAKTAEGTAASSGSASPAISPDTKTASEASVSAEASSAGRNADSQSLPSQPANSSSAAASAPPAAASAPPATASAPAAPPAASLPSQAASAAAPKLSAPDFTVYDAAGNAVKLSDFAGKPIIVNFWATWCGPCQSELPDFNEAYLAYHDQIQFLFVNDAETVQTVETFVKTKGYSFPVHYDRNYSLMQAYSVRYIPDTLIIGRDGNLINKFVGVMNKSTLNGYISQLLA